MWCINTHILGTCIIWILSVTTFIMMVILTVTFTQLSKDLNRIDTQVFGPYKWWNRKSDTESRIDTLFAFYAILEKEVRDKNKKKGEK